MKNNFNRIAGVYDLMARIVFGASIRKAQIHFIDKVQTGDSVLIIGGGTGWILQELDKLRKDIRVVYIDLSREMIKSAQKGIPYEHLRVDFIRGSQHDIPKVKFDVVITHFFLDVFGKDHLLEAMKKIKSHLKDSGLWLCADFVRSKSVLKTLLLKLMHWFFLITTNLESTSLQNFEAVFSKVGFKKVSAQLYYYKMIETSVYRRSKDIY